MKNKIRYFLKANIAAKSLSILVTVCLLLGSVPVLVGASETPEGNTMEEYFGFSPPIIIPRSDGFVDISIPETTDNIAKSGEPELPGTSHFFELPLGSTDVNVEFEHSSVETMTVETTVKPGPIRMPVEERQHPIWTVVLRIYRTMLDNRGAPNPYEGVAISDGFNEDVYESNEPYGAFFDYDIYVGLNKQNELKTFVRVDILPCVFSDVASGELSYITSGTATVTYEEPGPQTLEDEEEETYDFLIITPQGYVQTLQPLVAHKTDENLANLDTLLVTLDEIYSGAYFELPEWIADDQEAIKYFVYKAILEWEVTHILAVGGYRTVLGFDNPNLQFPVRVSYNDDGGDPYYTTDQYYTCTVKYDSIDGYVFDDWDTNGNDRFAEWDYRGYDVYDPHPDVIWGRLSCRNRHELRTMIDKIIYYETHTYGEEWFGRIMSITGDGFGDHTNLGQAFDSNLYPDGDYTVYAQSRAGTSLYGPIDEIHFTIDHSAESIVTPGNDEHTKIQPRDEEQTTYYPGLPVAEIVVPQDGDVLGYDDVNYVPDPNVEFYDVGQGWANVNYNSGVLTLRAKSYDPSPQEFGNLGSHTYLKYWVNDSEGTVWESSWKPSSEWYEGEVECLHTFDMMPTGVYPNWTKLHTSSGLFYTMWDVIDAYSEGYGWLYFAGHSSCMVWGDHLPGIPGGRNDGQVNGLAAINLNYGIERYAAEQGDPLFPVDQLTNGYRLPIVLFSGCHSGQFDTSFMKLFKDPEWALFGDGYGTWIPESLAEWQVRTPSGGAIALIGFTGLGYGNVGVGAGSGVTGLMMHFIVANHVAGDDWIGDAVTHSLADYADDMGTGNIMIDKVDRKTFEETQLLGDPTLMIGGYEPVTGALGDEVEPEEDESGYLKLEDTGLPVPMITFSHASTIPQPLVSSEFKITNNPANDTNPRDVVQTPKNEFLVGYTYETPGNGAIEPGFAYSSGGGIWDEAIYANPDDSGDPSVYSYWWYDEDNHEWIQNFVGSCFVDTPFWSVLVFPDILDPSTWDRQAYWGYGNFFPGKWGSAGTAYTDNDGTIYGGLWSHKNGLIAAWIGNTNDVTFGSGSGSGYDHFQGTCDQSTGWHLWACDKPAANTIEVVRGPPNEGAITHSQISGAAPDVDAKDGYMYLVYEDGSAIKCRQSSDNGLTWNEYTVNADGTHPRVLINNDTASEVYCYFARGGDVYKSTSTDNGVTWSTEIQVGTVQVDESLSSPFAVTHNCIVYDKGDGDLYCQLFNPTVGIKIGDIEVEGSRVVSMITNAGSVYSGEIDWTLQIQGAAPLARWMRLTGTPFELLLTGIVLRGGYAGANQPLSPGETAEIASSSAFGLGHIDVVISVYHDEELIAYKAEDGFLFGGRLLLYHGDE